MTENVSWSEIRFIVPLAIRYFRPHPHPSITPVTISNSPYLFTLGITPSFLGLVSTDCRGIKTSCILERMVNRITVHSCC